MSSSSFFESVTPMNFIPSEEQAVAWEADYRSMQTNMIPGESKSCAELIEQLTEVLVFLFSLRSRRYNKSCPN